MITAYVVIERWVIIRDSDGEVVDALDENDDCAQNPRCGGCSQCLLMQTPDDFEIEYVGGETIEI